MLQIYKKRNFGELVGDTFTFFKIYGKNYLKNYFLINGLLLILLLIVFVLGFRDLFSQLFLGNTDGTGYFFEQYYNQNSHYLIIATVLSFLFLFVLMVINYCYPVFYIKILNQNSDKNIKPDQISTEIKQNIGRILKFILGMSFVFMPLAFIALGISYALIIIVIGILVVLFIVPIILNIGNFILYDYFTEKKSFLQSFKYAIKAQFGYQNSPYAPSPFWKYWASTVVVYLIIQIISTVITIIPLFFNIFLKLSNSVQIDEKIMVVFCFISYTVSIVMTNLLYVNAGLMYYDSRDDLHRKEDLKEIDLIGKDA